MEQHLLVKMLMVSLRISGKQKIVAAAEVIRQFARWMEIFVIIINKQEYPVRHAFGGNEILILLLLFLMLQGANLFVKFMIFMLYNSRVYFGM